DTHTPLRKKTQRKRCPRIVAATTGLLHPARKRSVRRGTGMSRLSFRSPPSSLGKETDEMLQEMSPEASSVRKDERTCCPPTPPINRVNSSSPKRATRF